MLFICRCIPTDAPQRGASTKEASFNKINHAISYVKEGCCGYVKYGNKTAVNRACNKKKIFHIWGK